MPHWWVGMVRQPCRRRTGPRRAISGSGKSRDGAADPRYQTMEQAVRNAQNALNVMLHRQVEMAAVRPLMQPLLTQMAKAFPAERDSECRCPDPAANTERDGPM